MAAVATFLCLLILAFVPLFSSEYTVVMPDSSSALVDAPQTGFSDRARTDPDEQRAVYAIMEATGNGWATSIPDVCRGRWHGIECMPDTEDVYHVVSLAFGALSADTAFPTCDLAHAGFSPALLALPHLRSLFFYRCFVGGATRLPAFLGRLGPMLRSLVVRDNELTGGIPEELGNLTGLRVLDLHGNWLSSSVPSSLRRLTRLRLLDLSYNQLNGPLPDFSFPDLTVMDVSHNHLQGRIPSSISQCNSLVKIDLSRNLLAGPIPPLLGELTDLILLDLSHNRLSGPFPCSFPNSLTTLLLSSNPMSPATIPENAFKGMTELNTLVLSNMGLRGLLPESIGELEKLRVLYLDGNKFNGSLPRSLMKLEKLSELRVNDNMLAGPIPIGRELVWKMGRKLMVHNNSGLCYDLSNGRYEGMESMSGVRYCEAERQVKSAEGEEGKRATKHYAVANTATAKSSSPAPPSGSSSSDSVPGLGTLERLAAVAELLFFVTVLL